MKTDLKVLVTARRYDELKQLMEDDSIPINQLELYCSSIGTGIARSVLEGKGQALISACRLRTTFDTDDGVAVMHYYFSFTVKGTQRPLLFELLRTYGG